MFKIIHKEALAADIIKLTVEVPQIAKKASAGQFVAVIADEKGERLPLTLADWDKDTGTITLIFHVVGYSSRKLASLNQGDAIAHILGPLGRATNTQGYKSVICIGGGVGIAEVYPVSRAFKAAGARVIGITGARAKEHLILEKPMSQVCAELFITTDDGSYGYKGLVTDILKNLLEVTEKSTHTNYPDLVYAIGPIPMMKAVSDLTRGYNIKTIVSLNPIMVDATGMCGSCRCRVDGKTVFGCVDGPDFDGHKVDFDELSKRLKLFSTQEKLIHEKRCT